MAALKDVVSLYQNLKREWTKTPYTNLKKCGELLNQLKVIYIFHLLIELSRTVIDINILS